MADDFAIHVHDLAGALARRDSSLPLDDRGVAVFLRHEADLVRLFLVCDGKAGLLRDGANLRLRQLAEREECLGKLRLRELEEEVRLILREILRLAELAHAVSVRNSRVMDAPDLVGPARLRLLKEEIER